MRSPLSPTRLLTAGLTLALLAAPMLATAQERFVPGRPADAPAMGVSQPVVIVTIGSLGELMQDVNYIAGAVGQPQAGGIFTMMATQFTQGIDMTKPIGIVVPIVDGAPEPIGMLPTADIRTVLKRVEAQTGPPDVLDDGTMVMNVGANTVFIRQVGPWAMVARSREVLDAAPADPTAVIAEMGDDYDLGIKLDVQQIPDEAREAFMAQIRQGFEQTMSRQENVTDESMKALRTQMDELERLFKDFSSLIVGLDLDSSGRQVVLDVAFDAVPGSELAKMYDGQAPAPSAYASVIRPDAAGYLHGASTVSPEAAERIRPALDQMLAGLRSMFASDDKLSVEDEADILAVAKRVSDFIVESNRAGKVDVGALLLADAQKLQFAAGMFVHDGNEAAAIVKDIAARVQGRGDAPKFVFDREKYGDVTLHLIEAAIPAKQDELRKIFGESVKIHVGTGPQAVYVALGDISLPLVMELIDNAKLPKVTGEQISVANFRMAPVLQFAQSIEADDTFAAMLAAISRSDDGGQIAFETKRVDNGQATRIIVGDGVLQAIGAVVRERQNAAMQQGGF